MYVCQLQGNSPEIAGVMLQSERTQCRKWRGKVHRLHCWAAGSPAATPNLPLAPSTSGMPSSSTLRPHTGSPRFPEDLKGNHGPPHLCPTPPQAWYAKRRVTTPRGTLCNSAAGAADRPVERVLLRASQGPHCWSLSASRSTPQPRGHSGRPGRAPLTWAGRLAFRASPEAERRGWAGWGFYTRPILPV